MARGRVPVRFMAKSLRLPRVGAPRNPVAPASTTPILTYGTCFPKFALPVRSELASSRPTPERKASPPAAGQRRL